MDVRVPEVVGVRKRKAKKDGKHLPNQRISEEETKGTK